MEPVQKVNAMARRRGGRFRDRPENVEINTVGEVTYFKYKYPDGQLVSIGNSRDAKGAFDKAHMLNGHFAQLRLGLEMTALAAPKLRASSTNPSIPTLVSEFRTHHQKRKKYSQRTLEEQDYRLNAYAKKWATKTVKEFQTTDIAAFLNGLTDNAYVKHRADLHSLFQFAGHQGYRTDNPVAITIEKGEADKVRQRHTWEGYQKILNFPGRPAADGQPALPATPEWLRRAMRIGLYSLQRRDDVVKLHKLENKVDLVANTFTVLQRKTRNYKNPVWIEIEMGSELRSAVVDCLKSEVLCPYLIHRKPDKISQQDRDAKGHPFAVLPGYLSKAFAKARDNSGAYDHLKPDERPTFHELRSLGTHLYEQAGYSDEYIMALSGHAKKETLERYKKDHEDKKPRKVSAGMNVAQLPGNPLGD